MPAVQLNQVSVWFSSFTAMQGVDLPIDEGGFTAVIGPAGCSKGALLGAMTGLLKPAGDTISVFDEPSAGLDGDAGFMMQQNSLLPWKTVLDNVTLGLVLQDIPVDEARGCARLWMKKISLADFETRYPHQLSGGQKRRIGMAQTLILSPEIVLMDESFSALNVHTRHLVQGELLRPWQEDRKSLLFITHDLGEAIALVDRAVVISAGPASHSVGGVEITLPHPRSVSEINMSNAFIRLYHGIWSALGTEVEKGHTVRH